MNARQAKFVQEYLLDLNATQAAIRAGYSKKTAGKIGFENLQKPEIAEAIAKAQEKASAKLEISHESIINDLVEIAQEARKDGVYPSVIKAKELIGKHFGMWPNKQEITGAGGGPVQIEAFDASKLSPEEREALRALLLKGKGG